MDKGLFRLISFRFWSKRTVPADVAGRGLLHTRATVSQLPVIWSNEMDVRTSRASSLCNIAIPLRPLKIVDPMYITSIEDVLHYEEVNGLRFSDCSLPVALKSNLRCEHADLE